MNLAAWEELAHTEDRSWCQQQSPPCRPPCRPPCLQIAFALKYPADSPVKNSVLYTKVRDHMRTMPGQWCLAVQQRLSCTSPTSTMPTWSHV